MTRDEYLAALDRLGMGGASPGAGPAVGLAHGGLEGMHLKH